MESIKENELKISDMLGMSKELWGKNKENWAPMSPEHGRTFVLYMIEEIGEVIAILKKKGEDKIMDDETTRERFIEEMCDVLMYYSDVLNRFGISAEEFSAIYLKKFKRNMGRDYQTDHDNH